MSVQHPEPPIAGAAAAHNAADTATGGVLPRVLPFAIYLGFIGVQDVLERAGLTGDQLRWLYAVKIGAVLLALLACRRHYTELTRARLGAGMAAISAVVGVLVLALWISLNADWMQVGVSTGFNPTDAAGRIDWLLVALRIGGAALIVPVMEELFWRSFLLRWLERQHFLSVHPSQVKVKAVVITVLLFGIEHNLWLAGMVAGAAYTLLYMRSGTLWAPILAHAVTNGLLGAWILATGNWTYW
ncbi:CAAX prenyl protease-related protein [Pseudoduganella sp. UC29_106]|uniref:CAAX prenyl protease-related protein n=1 Tax=Pseudoduganella sp. UC29_106 TaxID=3374553 RepID=UPI0037578FD6